MFIMLTIALVISPLTIGYYHGISRRHELILLQCKHHKVAIGIRAMTEYILKNTYPIITQASLTIIAFMLIVEMDDHRFVCERLFECAAGTLMGTLFGAYVR